MDFSKATLNLLFSNIFALNKIMKIIFTFYSLNDLISKSFKNSALFNKYIIEKFAVSIEYLFFWWVKKLSNPRILA